VHHVAAAAIEDAAQKIKRASDVQMTDINMPVIMRLQGLHEAGAFLAGPGRLPGQESGLFQDAIDTGRTAGDLVGIEHHEGQAAIAFERIGPREGNDAMLFVIGEPMIARDPGIVLVDLAEAADPIVIFAGADADPGQKPRGRDVGFARPGADEIDDRVARVMGNPAAR